MDFIARHPVVVHGRAVGVEHGAAGIGGTGVNVTVVHVVWRHVFTRVGGDLTRVGCRIGLPVVRLRAGIGGQRPRRWPCPELLRGEDWLACSFSLDAPVISIYRITSSNSALPEVLLVVVKASLLAIGINI